MTSIYVFKYSFKKMFIKNEACDEMSLYRSICNDELATGGKRQRRRTNCKKGNEIKKNHEPNFPQNRTKQNQKYD